MDIGIRRSTPRMLRTDGILRPLGRRVTGISIGFGRHRLCFKSVRMAIMSTMRGVRSVRGIRRVPVSTRWIVGVERGAVWDGPGGCARRISHTSCTWREFSAACMIAHRGLCVTTIQRTAFECPIGWRGAIRECVESYDSIGGARWSGAPKRDGLRQSSR